MFKFAKVLLLVTVALAPALTKAEETKSPSILLSQAQEYADRRQGNMAAAHYLQLIFQSENLGVRDDVIAEAHYGLSFGLTARPFSAKERYYHLVTAAELGHQKAQAHLGNVIINNVHGEKPNKYIIAAMPRQFSLKEGITLLYTSMKQGNVDAHTQLARLYRFGRAGVLLDPDYAEQLERLAYEILLVKADQNDPDAMVKLANFTRRGIGVPKDTEQAMAYEFSATRLYEDLAETGDIRAMRLAGGRYKSGKSPLSDADNIERAVFWYHRLVVENPVPFDLSWLASFYKDGKGFPKNLVLAHALYNYNSTLGNSKFPQQQRDLIAKELSKGQLSEALGIARTCVAEGMVACLPDVPKHTN